MGPSIPPDPGPDVAEPFRRDPDFWASVCASADAVVLLVGAIAAAAALRLTGTGTVLALLPFTLPGLFLVRAATSSARFHRAHQPLPSTVDTTRGEQAWRDAERIAVAAVFGRALVRARRPVSATPPPPQP